MASSPDVGTDAEDRIAQYLREQRFYGKSDRTLEAYERVLRDFERSVHHSQTQQVPLDGVDRSSCMEWVHGLRGGLKPSTVASYASYVNRFYRYMIDIGAFDHNPMHLVVEQMSESIETDPVRRDLSIDDMRAFVASVSHPLDRALIMTFLKTGIRVGELCNLDIRDISIPIDTGAPSGDDTRAALDGRPDAMFVDHTPSRGDNVHGEVRTASNKRQRPTIIPIDAELQLVLETWFIIRPDPISPANPLFVDTNSSWGTRLQPESVRYRLRRHAERMGWHEPGADAADNVTPHYFRHFFTTYLRDRTGDRGIVKYLRGDVADDVIDTYTHNWGDRVKRRYTAHIYSLL